jgi:hypothetical protein
MSCHRWIAAVTVTIAGAALLGCEPEPVRVTYSASAPAPVASTSAASSPPASSVVAPVVTPMIWPSTVEEHPDPPRPKPSADVPAKKPQSDVAKQSSEPTYVWRKRCSHPGDIVTPWDSGDKRPEPVCVMERVKVSSSRKSRNPTFLAAPPPTSSGRTIRSKI